MRQVSLRRQELNRQVAQFRRDMVERVGTCEICGDAHLTRYPISLRRLCCHEIANGPDRHKALDKPYALLVVCWYCNQYVLTNKAEWPQPKQLAVLRERRPEDFDLVATNYLINPRAPNRILLSEVNYWQDRLCWGPETDLIEDMEAVEW